MQSKLMAGLAIVAAAATLAAFSTTQAVAATFVTDCGAGETIQHRLDKNVRDGDTVEVSGSCEENVVIDKDRVTLQCLAGSEIDGGGAIAITVEGGNVRILDCSIVGGSTGILVSRGGSALIERNTMSGLTTGIAVTQSSYARITDNNEITGNTGMGIVVSNASHADIAGNKINDNDSNGVFITRSSVGELVGNEIKGNGDSGVFVQRTSTVELSADITHGRTPNEIEGNGNWGVRCLNNAAIRFGEPQDWGSGNTPDNVQIAGSGLCASSGNPGP